MTLVRLSVRNFRVFETADVELSAHFNLILGPNAAGKTSLLEAIHFLSTGRSFRTSRFDELIRRGAERVVVRGELIEPPGAPWGMGITRSSEGIRARVRGRRVASIAELATALPIVAVYPEGQDLIMGAPGLRRSLVDWGLFYGDSRFRETRARFQRALKQRNALLRRKGSDEALSAWEEELGKEGEAIDTGREDYVKALGLAVNELEGTEGVSLRYRQGWTGGGNYVESLARGRDRDRLAGFTQAGPHRADLVIEVGGTPARLASRGQQKVLVALLRMAQVRVVAEQTGKRPLVLVDDLASELDADRRELVLKTLGQLGSQLIVTAVERTGIPELTWEEQRVFHVEHGGVQELI